MLNWALQRDDVRCQGRLLWYQVSLAFWFLNSVLFDLLLRSLLIPSGCVGLFSLRHSKAPQSGLHSSNVLSHRPEARCRQLALPLRAPGRVGSRPLSQADWLANP